MSESADEKISSAHERKYPENHDVAPNVLVKAVSNTAQRVIAWLWSFDSPRKDGRTADENTGACLPFVLLTTLLVPFAPRNLLTRTLSHSAILPTSSTDENNPPRKTFDIGERREDSQSKCKDFCLYNYAFFLLITAVLSPGFEMGIMDEPMIISRVACVLPQMIWDADSSIEPVPTIFHCDAELRWSFVRIVQGLRPGMQPSYILTRSSDKASGTLHDLMTARAPSTVIVMIESLPLERLTKESEPATAGNREREIAIGAFLALLMSDICDVDMNAKDKKEKLSF
ncbi:hypothetical protein EV424DRAFT_1346315 [Suillus variegatus]|nr:hypothetical protein EV424DRAFT_1346315 [Suillus variegatus]